MAPHAPCLVNVHSKKWDLMTFPVNQYDKVKKINEHIRSKTKVSVHNQVLQLGSKTLKPHKSLSSYGIDKEKTIHLTLKVVKPSNEELTLVLVDLTSEGQKHDLQVRRSYSVSQVKMMIEVKTAIPPEDQIVNCNGKKLEDGKTMEDYNIEKGSLLFLADYCESG